MAVGKADRATSRRYHRPPWSSPARAASTTVEARFYGPCVDCRHQLRAAFRREGRVVEVAEYEPKMNVTPNAVALKDD